MASKPMAVASANVRFGATNDSSMAQGPGPTPEDVLSVIDSLKKHISAERCVSIKKRMEDNRQKLTGVTNHLYKSSMGRRICGIADTNGNPDLLTKRQKDAINMRNDIHASNGDKESNGSQDCNFSTAVLLGSNVAVKNAVRPIKLPEAKRLPPYTTWIFLDRNQRMTEDQSVVGRRRIYYDQNGGEALICSDSEEEIIEEEEEKRDFVESEDYILRMAVKEFGLSDLVLESLAQCFSRNTCELKARYEVISNGENIGGVSKSAGTEENSLSGNSFLEKDLEAALDSFDNLFCRRCLVFDCRLHGCSQDLVFPAEKQPVWIPPNAESTPCGPNCFQLELKPQRFAGLTSSSQGDAEKKSSGGAGMHIAYRKKSFGPSARRWVKGSQSESTSSNAKNISESSDSENGNGPGQETASASHSASPKTKTLGKGGIGTRNSKRAAECVLVCLQKRQKKTLLSDSDSIGEAPDCSLNGIASDPPVSSSNDILRKEEFFDENVCTQQCTGNKLWKPLEKGLLEKGVEIFGRNSCLISRNLLNGLKTCWEVFQYINCNQGKVSGSTGDAEISLMEGYSKGNNEVRRRSRFLRRRGRVRRLKYTWKSAAYHSIRKRITERKDQPCRQYNPCGCQSACGKQCPCLQNGTCCEKYCGCPKSCKNRFRGCHCAKSQCRSRQCPCFAADRECDPDVCRNCWVSCGDGTLGIPSQRGDNYECRNMKLLLKQQQRVLLGRSDVSGWGAFLKSSVGKHEYLGEYTGELISHREADKRGKIYDRENSSFLFNLNDQFVLDAYRKGDKLKFANHSPDPNCYAKVIMVAGDHRVGIFAKERISAGEELFYDYRYEPDRAPAWARKPEASGTRKDDSAPSSGRAKKLA
ncbi:histone-lysine N-methyltransferase CLF-like isoform X1 [Prosopis cineraria]|uniref:histone-lysine N-methyltransferase CLF-like isoform X1 n=1 Tax=Prosopis cineraria TaxID=364024 RepID=UPI00240F1AC6|nr:histone-lysine N-methyltransferase CLF-like isoform X1 [Prosopis cineraria]